MGCPFLGNAHQQGPRVYAKFRKRALDSLVLI
jgi:hypothetical protein